MGHNYLDSINAKELERLRAQHEAWRPETTGLLLDAGFASAGEIVEFGCGPGFTVFDLASKLNPSADILGLDISDFYLEFARSNLSQHCLSRTSIRKHDIAQPLELSQQFDAAFCRWFLAWVSKDLQRVLRNILHSLKPGGVFACMEYLTLRSTSYCPPCSSLPRYLQAWEEFYQQAGGTTEIGSILPAELQAAGFVIKELRCVGGLSHRGDRLFNWWQRLNQEFNPNFKERGLLSQAELTDLDNFFKSDPTSPSFIYTPVLLQVIAQKPVA